MRKIKKINGFLVVRFNDREKRNYLCTWPKLNRPILWGRKCRCCFIKNIGDERITDRPFA